MNKLKNRQYGMSLIEIMIAMVISLLLLGGAITMFATNKRVYNEQNEMGQLQENARFAMGLLVKDIRLATFVGCSDDIGKVNNQLNSATVQAISNFSEGTTSSLIEGSENGANWQPSNSTDAVASMITTTDAIPSDGITVRYVQPTSVAVTAAMTTTGSDLTVDAGNGFTEGSFVAVADCGNTDIFQVTNTDADATGTVEHKTTGPTPANSSSNLSQVYDADAVMYRLANYRYYIQNSLNGSGPALWRTTPGGAEELVEGVESMQILYGEDTSGNAIANTFVDASAVTNWANVISVKIGLLMRTVEEYGTVTDTDTHTLLGADITVNDRRRRRIFTATVEIRNKRS